MLASLKWFHWAIIAAMLGVTACFVFKKDRIENTNASQVKFVFGSVIPKVIGMGAVTLCQTVHFSMSQTQLDPWRNSSHRALVKHELTHVGQCEAIGHVDFFLGYYGNSFGQAIRKGFKKAYTENDFEVYAVAHQYDTLSPRDLEIIRRYWP